MLLGKTLPAAGLTERQIKTMFRIMQNYYDNILWDNFVSDLRNKRDVVLLCDDNDAIHGFTTLTVFAHGEHAQLLFSGDTIVEKEYWGDNNLPHAWLINALGYAQNFKGKTYWLLLAKGYKTYKYLHTFFNEFYPRAQTATPQHLQEIIDAFANKQFGAKYQNGVYVEGKDFLKGEYADIGEAQLRDKNTAFFIERNPGYKNGNELVCLCEISVGNLNRLGRRILGR